MREAIVQSREASLDANRSRYRKDLADQLRRLERDIPTFSHRFVTAVHEQGHDLVLTVGLAQEETVIASVIARLGDPQHRGRGWADWLTLMVESDESRTQLLELVWFDESSSDKTNEYGDFERVLTAFEQRINRAIASSERGFNAAADRREGPLAEVDAVDGLRQHLRTILNSFVPSTKLAQVPFRAIALPAESSYRETAPIIDLTLYVQNGPPPERDVEIARPGPALVGASHKVVDRAGEAERNLSSAVVVTPPDFDPAEFNEPEGLLYGFALACRGEITSDDLPGYAQRAMELQIVRNRALLRARSLTTEAGIGFVGAMKLFGVGVAFGVEVAAATFAFDPWLHGNPAGIVYTLTGVGLIGGGLVPITRGRARQAAMAVSVAWSLGVAALTMQNADLVDPLQARMPGFSQIDEAAKVILVQGQLREDEKTKTALEAALERAKRDFVGARRGQDEQRRDFQDGERKREALYREAQQKLQAMPELLRRDRENLKAAELAWQGVREGHWTHHAAAAIVFTLTALLGAIGPIYLGLWLNERQPLHVKRLAAKRERHRLKERTRSLEVNESAQRAEARHVLGVMRAYYASVLVNDRHVKNASTDNVFSNLTPAVEAAVSGLRAARRKKVWGLAF